jgi:hypothetical protein
MDLKGATAANIQGLASYLNDVTTISQNYYPERLARIYVINAPLGISVLWTRWRCWLSEVTIGKFHILGSNYKSELLKQIRVGNLPTQYGGECECSGCCGS